MKNKQELQRMLYVFAIIIFSIGLIQCTQKTEEPVKEKLPQIIASSEAGGDWANVSTWLQSMIPTSDNDVNISGKGKVTINGKAECLNLMVDNGATLEVLKGASLVIKHHIINEGTIVNNGEIIVRDMTHK